MLFQPSNIYPSTFSGIGAGTVDVTQGLNVSWQVNGDTPMTAYQIKIYQNDSSSTLMYDSGSLAVTPAFEPHDKYGNPTFFSTLISAAALSTAGIVNGYQYGYKMLITQYWGVSDYVEQTSASVFITRSNPSLTIDAIPNPVTSSSITITATYSQAQGDPISTVEWVFAQAGSESTPIKETGSISTQILSFDADGLITGNTYSIMCNVVTANGVYASTGFVQFSVSYPSSSISVNYQLAQLKNSSAAYLSWEGVGSNILAYPYTDSTKTTNGITFTVNGEGDVKANGTASADAYFTMASGTLSQIGITAGQRLIITSGYSGAKIEVTETNNSNIVVSTITGNDPLQYIVPATTNTLKFSIVIPSGVTVSSQMLQPMFDVENRIVGVNDLSVTMLPIQSLNGYDSPWPAGGGANKLLPNTSDGTSNLNGITLSYSATTEKFSISGTNSKTDAAWLLINWTAGKFPSPSAGETWYFSSNLQTGLYAQITYRDSNNANKSLTGSFIGNGTFKSVSFVIPNDFDHISNFQIGCYKTTGAITASTNIVFELSQAQPSSWTPCSNICPITGRTGLNVYRTGKNLLSSILIHGVWSSGVLYNHGTSPSKHQATQDKINVCGGQSYCLSFSGDSTNAITSVTYAEFSNGTYKKTTTKYSKPYSIQFDSDTDEIAVSFNSTSNITEPYLTNIQLELGSTATTYEPYNGNTYAVDWTTHAGTVYGGTVDVVTGVLTVDKLMFSANTSTMNNSENYPGWKNAGVKANNPKQGNVYDATVNVGSSYGINTNGANDVVFLPKQSYNNMTQTQWIALAQDVQIVYELATPLTYQLTEQEVVLLTNNNIWSDSGNVSVTYTKNTGIPATVSGSIVTITDSKAVNIPTPTYIPGVIGVSIYRYSAGSPVLGHVYDFTDDTTSILDYHAPSQGQISYLIVVHASAYDLFCLTNSFTPTFWFYSILLCDKDNDGVYHVSKEYIFKYGVESGTVSNNNDPTIQKNFTPYPNRQPISSLYKTGKLTSYIGKTNSQNQYSDSVSLQNAIYDISTSPLTKFLKTRKGDILMIDTAAAIQMKTEDATTQQALRATVDWVEVGDALNQSIVSVPTDSFWPI